MCSSFLRHETIDYIIWEVYSAGSLSHLFPYAHKDGALFRYRSFIYPAVGFLSSIK